jgi:diguanylate cyclase (GGDEF)-like protein
MMAVGAESAPVLRILVVDDDAGTREAMKAVLEESGYAVEVAADGEEALALVATDPPDLVVSDVCMPNSDGFDLTRRLRLAATSRDIPLILVSARAEMERRVAGLDYGADDFIAKPVDVDELLARIRVHLRHARREKELSRRSMIDMLTGALNRRGILDVVTRERERSVRHGSPLTVVMADANRFKWVNDTLGHAVGDAVLQEIADRLVLAVRAIDRVGRFGGDEFLIVLPETDEDEAAALLPRIRSVRATAGDGSVGVAAGAATLRDAEPLEELLARADAAMYEDKRTRSSTRP